MLFAILVPAVLAVVPIAASMSVNVLSTENVQEVVVVLWAAAVNVLADSEAAMMWNLETGCPKEMVPIMVALCRTNTWGDAFEFLHFPR